MAVVRRHAAYASLDACLLSTTPCSTQRADSFRLIRLYMTTFAPPDCVRTRAVQISSVPPTSPGRCGGETAAILKKGGVAFDPSVSVILTPTMTEHTAFWHNEHGHFARSMQGRFCDQPGSGDNHGCLDQTCAAASFKFGDVYGSLRQRQWTES